MKAESYAAELGIADFKASEGWLSKWKQRHNINYGQINGEARDVDRNITDGWLEKVWPDLKLGIQQKTFLMLTRLVYFTG